MRIGAESEARILNTTDPLRVVKIASGAGASYAARYLGSLGAQVTKVRLHGIAESALPELDVGKGLVEAGVSDLRELARTADIVLVACDAPQVDAEPLALAVLRAANPGLITAAITPFGESGPNREHRATDLISIHAGGLGYGTPPRVIDPEKEQPLGIPGDPVEALTGIVVVLGILHALHERDRGGAGRHVDVSAQDAVVSLMFNNIAGVMDGGASPGRLASDRPGARRQFLPAADGLLVQMAGRPHHQTAWLDLLGEPGRALIAKLEAGSRPAELATEIAAASDAFTTALSKREATDRAQAAHIPVEPVLSPAEVLECRQLEARGFWERGSAGVRIAGHPFGPLATGDAPRTMPSRIAGKAASGQGPLAGMRVLDFTWVFAGPIATRVLAALGAEVIKIEGPAGTENRPGAFLARSLQGGKRSARLDLREPANLEAVRAMVRDADVIVENFSTGVMERYGLGWEQVHAVNPRLVMLSISGMGRTGPYAHHVMLGQLAQGYSGLTAITGYEGGPPRGIEDGGFWSDPVTGYSGAAAVLAALREREATGAGRRIDISLVEATVATLFRPLLAAARGDGWSTRGNFHPAMAPHDVYRAAGDDAWVALACPTDAEWQALCRVIGRADLAGDAGLSNLEGRQGQRGRLRDEIERWTKSMPPSEASALLQAAGIPAAPSRTTADVTQDPHLQARGVFVEEDGRPVAMRMAWVLDPPAPVSYGPAPQTGADTSAVLAGEAAAAAGRGSAE